MALKRPGEELRRSLSKAGSRLWNPVPARFKHGDDAFAQMGEINRLIGLQHSAGQLVREYALEDGTEVRVLLLNGVDRVEIVSPAQPDGTITIPVQVIYILYHGWLPWYPPGYPGGPPAPRVYCDARLLSYLSGSGTAHPEVSGAHQYLIGTMEVSGGIPTWPARAADLAHGEAGRPLTLDAGHSYPDPLPVPSLRTPPPVWTGEARCRDQCGPLAGGLSWAEVLPTGWAADSMSVGYVWLDGRPWVARITAAGMDIAEVLVPAPLTRLLVWLAAGSGLAIDLTMYRAWVYAFGSARTSTVIHLLSAATVAPVYAGGASSLHPQCGWQWFWQPAITSPARAIQVTTLATGGHYASRLCDINLTWTGGVPAASLSVGSDQEWGGPLFVFWTPTGDGVEGALQPSGSAVLGSPANVYAYTVADGTHRTVNRVAQSGTGSVSFGTLAAWPSICGAGAWSSSGGSGTRIASGGWRIDGTTSVDASITILSASSRDDKSVTISAASSLYIRKIYRWHSSWCSLSGPDLAGVGYFCEATAIIGTGSARIQEFRGSSGGGLSALVLLPGDNGAAVLSYQGWDGGTFREGSTLSAPVIEISGNWIKTGNPAFNIQFRNDAANYTYAFQFGAGSAVTEANFNAGYSGNYISLGASQTASSQNKYTMGMVSSDGEARSLSLGAWPGLLELAIGSLYSLPTARVSGWGQAMYSTTPTTMVYPAGLSSVATSAPAIDPIGSA